MNAMEAIWVRRSCRRFDPGRPLDEGKLSKIVEAGTRAPSAKNRQPWRFVLASNPSVRLCIAEALRGIDLSGRDLAPEILSCQAGSVRDSAACVEAAPCVAFVFYQSDASWSAGNEAGWRCFVSDLEAVDMLGIGACMENMAIAATALGIDTLWMCDVLFAAEEISAILGEERTLVAAMAFGYEVGDEVEGQWNGTSRLPLEDVCRWI